VKGGYCLVLSLNLAASIELKNTIFSLQPGTYIYCGSALISLDARLERHIRNFKGGTIKRFWHIDHLLPASERLSVVKAASTANVECRLVSLLAKRGLQPIRGFGSSDCRCGCKGHLLYSEGSFSEATQKAVASFMELGLAPEVLDVVPSRPL